MLNELAEKIHENAIKHGFYDDEIINIPERLMLIVSELGEAMEAYRKDHYSNIEKFKNRLIYEEKHENFYEESEQNLFQLIFEETIKNGFQDEISDTIIRLLDLCSFLEIDIDTFIELKMQYNQSRPYKHGKKC